jgi:hypothetical protein
MAITHRDYTRDAVEAAHSVLLELTHLLGEYRDDIVVVGGMVPGLLLSNAEPRHVGTLDVDLALDHRKFQESGYKPVQKLLLSRGYEPDDQQPFVFRRRANINGRDIVVEVDLLAGEYGGTGRSRRTQRVQDVRPRKARGCDLAFEKPIEVKLEGKLPDGGDDSCTVRVAAIVPFLVMKGMALRDRLKEKDAYDIYYCVRNYPEGLETLTEEFRIHLGNKLVQEGIGCIREKFASPTHIGPKHVADFEMLEDKGERERLQRDAYERINALLERLKCS